MLWIGTSLDIWIVPSIKWGEIRNQKSGRWRMDQFQRGCCYHQVGCIDLRVVTQEGGTCQSYPPTLNNNKCCLHFIFVIDSFRKKESFFKSRIWHIILMIWWGTRHSLYCVLCTLLLYSGCSSSDPCTLLLYSGCSSPDPCTLLLYSGCSSPDPCTLPLWTGMFVTW